jgi:hypothetical protein
MKRIIIIGLYLNVTTDMDNRLCSAATVSGRVFVDQNGMVYAMATNQVSAWP